MVERCLREISDWMVVHRLLLNEDKTLILQMFRQHSDLYMGTFDISGASISISSAARNLGVQMDRRLDMKAHVSQICRSSYMHLKNIGSIRNTG